MEKEISMSLQIGATLTIISTVLALVAFTVYFGNDIKTDAFQAGTEILVEIDEGYLSEMVGKENHIPMATAYNLMRTYSRRIPSVNCLIPGCTHLGGPQNLVYETPCLVNHIGGITGKVYLEVTNPYEGEYHITIHQDNSWY